MPHSLMRRYYFPAVSLSLVVLTLIAFADNLFTNVGQPSNRDPKFIVHGLLCGAWMIVLFVQSALVSVGNVRLHRRLGLFAVAIAIGVALSTIWVFYIAWNGWGVMTYDVKANRLLLPSFALFAALGFINRRQPARHKRFMYTGTLFMLEPVLGRVYDPAVVPAPRADQSADRRALCPMEVRGMARLFPVVVRLRLAGRAPHPSDHDRRVAVIWRDIGAGVDYIAPKIGPIHRSLNRCGHFDHRSLALHGSPQGCARSGRFKLTLTTRLHSDSACAGGGSAIVFGDDFRRVFAQ